jgi:alpha-amylase
MSDPYVQLCLVLHNHQPVGNFDGVFEEAYQDSYLPFLDVFEPFTDLNISLHTSGPLMKWLEKAHPEYLSRVAQLVSQGRIEIIGGAFYEPILTMIPVRDRVGQISRFSDWLQQRVCEKVNGMWMPERVWESSLTSAISEAGISYTVLDDFHFRRAGLKDEELSGYFIVEDEGKIARVFPGSERLRYLLPFHQPQDTIDYCRQWAEKSPGAVLVFGDDGEKFGTWPNTKELVYDRGWLKDLFQALTDNRDWLATTTLNHAVNTTPPRGKIYLPDASYREMTEWALPVNRQIEHDQLVHELEGHPREKMIESFLSGGFWRNFKVKYPETNHMYARMMYVSGLLKKATEQGIDAAVLASAEDHLYQGQCNCSYWHGAFGGIYLPHLRNAVYQHLLIADRLLEKGMGRPEHWIEATTDDFNFDGRPEIRLGNEQITTWISPDVGGTIYELDLLNIGHNLGATIQRRPELYHNKVRQGETSNDGEAASIHDQIIFKQEGLDERLQYDPRLRGNMIDHFWDEDVAVNDLMTCQAMERGDFADGKYSAKIRSKPQRVQVMLTREGNAWGVPLKITKGVTQTAGSSAVEIAYMIEGLPQDRSMHFGVEFNFAGLPDNQKDRFFTDGDGNNLGQMQTVMNCEDTNQINLTDQWLGVDIGVSFDQPGGIFTYPVQSVSQSESGFEGVHQAVCVQPHWLVRGDEQGRWSVKMTLDLQTNADKHVSETEVAVSMR